jgi:hypothetical protein
MFHRGSLGVSGTLDPLVGGQGAFQEGPGCGQPALGLEQVGPESAPTATTCSGGTP